jgi:hypothetical protein
LSFFSIFSLAAALVLGGFLLSRRAGANGKAGLESAVVGPEGGVPMHGKGRFRSPFANPDAGEAPRARVGFLLDAIRNYDLKTGALDADFYLSLTSDKPMPEIDLIFINGRDAKRVIADKPTFKLFHYSGSFLSAPDLRLYPFDTQELTIELEDDDNGIDSIRLVPDLDHTLRDDGFAVAGWEVAYIEARTFNHYYPDRFDNDDLYYPRYVATSSSWGCAASPPTRCSPSTCRRWSSCSSRCSACGSPSTSSSRASTPARPCSPPRCSSTTRSPSHCRRRRTSPAPTS